VTIMILGAQVKNYERIRSLYVFWSLGKPTGTLRIFALLPRPIQYIYSIPRVSARALSTRSFLIPPGPTSREWLVPLGLIPQC